MEIDEKDYQILKAKADNYDKDMNALKTEYDTKMKSLQEERDSYKLNMMTSLMPTLNLKMIIFRF